MLARLIEDARTLAKAELALFRTDFYRRIGRARIGMLLCLIGAIIGQAAAVTFLVTLSFVLTPWIGRLGAAAVSVLFGLGMAIGMIRIGVRKLMLVVEDPDEEEDLAQRRAVSPINELFERVRLRSQAARNQLVETVGEAQARLHPQSLIADLADLVVDHLQTMSHNAVDAVRRRPGRAAMAVATIVLVLFRPVLFRIIGGTDRATRDSSASLKVKQTTGSAPTKDEETSS